MARADAKEALDKAQPQIFVTGKQLPAITDLAIAALNRVNRTGDGPRIFQKSDALVRLRHQKERLEVEILSPNSLPGELARSAAWYRTDKGHAIDISPPKGVAQDLLHLTAWNFPHLNMVAQAPFFDAQGRLIATPGYDPRAGIYLDTGLELEPVPDQPSAQEVAAARDLLLKELLVEFPFAEQPSRAHAVALILQPLLRLMIDGPTPAYAIDAPAAGTGKGLLGEVAAAVVTGRPAEQIPETGNREELRKELIPILLRDTPFAHFDNLKQKVSAAAFLSAVTARELQGRILGQSKMVSLPVRVTWILTGNNLRFNDEAARRICWIRLDAGLEQPWERTGFAHELPSWAHEQRPRLFRACLLLVQNWIAKGRVPFKERTLGSFESWAKTMGGILLAADIEGLLGNLAAFHQRAGDDSLAWREFVREWWDTHGEDPVQATELIYIARETLPDFGPSDNLRAETTKLGTALERRRDRIYARWRIIRATVKGSKGQRRPGFALREVKRDQDAETKRDQEADPASTASDQAGGPDGEPVAEASGDPTVETATDQADDEPDHGAKQPPPRSAEPKQVGDVGEVGENLENPDNIGA